MRKSTMRCLFVFLSVCLLAPTAYGTQQIPEKLLYKGEEYRLACVPLEKYFDPNHPKPTELSATNTACLRGYVGTWEIKDKILSLKLLQSYRGSKPFQKIPLSSVFKDKKSPIEATWYTGVLRCPQGKIVGWDRLIPRSLRDQDLYISASRGYFYMYERDLYLGVVRGNIVSEHVVDNKRNGATRSIRDWAWIASVPRPVVDDFKWFDLRDVVSENFSQYRESGESFRTRGIYVGSEDEISRLWVPPTPATKLSTIVLESMPRDYDGKQWQHVEMKANFEEQPSSYSGYLLHVDSIRPLKPGETMHHRDFKPPAKPAEETR